MAAVTETTESTEQGWAFLCSEKIIGGLSGWTFVFAKTVMACAIEESEEETRDAGHERNMGTVGVWG